MKNVISTLRIHIAYIVLLSYCPLHAEYISDAEMDSLAMKFYSWEKGNENDALLRQQVSVLLTPDISPEALKLLAP